MRGLEQTTHPLVGAAPMHRLRTIRISLAIRDELLVPGPLGTVASVHRSALNLCHGDQLITIALDALGGLPNGLSVASATPLDRLGLRQGMACHTDGYRLVLPAASVVIDLAGAGEWSPLMAAGPPRSAAERSTRAARALKRASHEVGAAGLGPLIRALAGVPAVSTTALTNAIAAALARIVEELQAGKPQAAARHGELLVGLGPGATPSGDDLLVGLCAGLLAIGHPSAHRFARHIAERAHGRTTTLAETFLWHAAQGAFAERVLRTARAVLEGDEEATRDAVSDALSWGASSGADLLLGLLVAIEADASDLPGRLQAACDQGAVAA